MRIGIITQARMGSTRLPGKVLKKVQGKTFLEYHLDRLKAVQAELWVATSDLPQDQAIVNLVKELRIKYFCGSETDVLGRYFACAQTNQLDVIIRVTSDCPLIDPGLINLGLTRYLQENSKQVYLANDLVETYPIGQGYEILSFELLKLAHQQATASADREHVTPYIRRNASGTVKLISIENTTQDSDLRMTLDTATDAEFLESLIIQDQCQNRTCAEITRLLRQRNQTQNPNALSRVKE